MTTYVSLQTPDTSVKREAGWCLSHTQAVFEAPIMYPSATAAANATEQRSASRNMPNVAVPVWFDHWGTYQGKYDNWGHVVAWIPGSGFLSSPTSGYGQQWFPSIEAVERAFNAKFRFWSLDINTKIVAKKSSGTVKPSNSEESEGEEMKAVYYTVGKTYTVLVFDSRSGFASEYTTSNYKYNNKIAGLGTGSFVEVTKSHYEALKSDLQAVRQGK